MIGAGGDRASKLRQATGPQRCPITDRVGLEEVLVDEPESDHPLGQLDLRSHVEELGTNEAAYSTYADQLLRPSARKVEREGTGMQIRSMVRTLDRIDAHALLFEMRQVDMDWLPASYFLTDEFVDALATRLARVGSAAREQRRSAAEARR